jgi:hypothetical protein
MNNELFVSNRNVFYFIDSTMGSSTKELEDIKSMIYKVLADYIKLRENRLLDYVHILVAKFKQYYSLESSDKHKLEVLKIIGKIFKHIKYKNIV